MIRNIVFDMGNVMIYFRKDLFLDQAGVSGEDRTLLARVVFDSLEWARLDRGSLLEDEAERIMCARLPARLHDKVHYFVYDWDKPLRPVRDMAPLVRELKAKGYGIYLLSNAASRQHVYWPDIPGSECFDGTLISELKAKGYGIYLLSNASYRQHDYWPRVPASRYFDGTLISADVKLVKPQPEIYRLLCETFSLDPDECVFIDDATGNAEAAYLCGLHPIVFHNDVDELREKLRAEGVDL